MGGGGGEGEHGVGGGRENMEWGGGGRTWSGGGGGEKGNILELNSLVKCWCVSVGGIRR